MQKCPLTINSYRDKTETLLLDQPYRPDSRGQYRLETDCDPGLQPPRRRIGQGHIQYLFLIL